MKHHATLISIALLVMLMAGCSTVSGVLPSSSADAGVNNAEASQDNEEAEADEDTFLASDDYRDGEEVVDVMLTRPEYAKMIEDFERQGVEFDWGWAAPGLDLSPYSTVHISVENFSASLNPDIRNYVRESFAAAMQRLGLQPVASGHADLDLDLAVVDIGSDYTYAFVTVIKPFIEIELRLKNNATDTDLLLVRNQEHDATPKQAAAEYAGELWQMLR